MSPSDYNPTQTPEPTPENIPDVVPETLAPEVAQTSNETTSNEPAKSKTAPDKSAKAAKPKKPLSKKAKIAILAAGWVLLLGIAAGVASLLKPAPEIVYTDAITEAYKFSAQEAGEVLDIVDDLDYYGYYSTNPLIFTQQDDDKYKYIYTISGLKDKTVEEKINNRLRDIAASYSGETYMTVTANYFNLLSLRLNVGGRYEYLTFDLNTGDELTFDDLFSKNANLAALLFNSFYDAISANIQFQKLAAEKRLAAEEYCPDPANCMAQYAPYQGETYDSLRALIKSYDDQMANIEQTALNSVQKYLAGDRQFYLNSFGPVFVVSDTEYVEMELKDNIRYAVYLKHYRSPDSLFEDDSLAETNLFFTESNSSYRKHYNEETDTYLFSYLDNLSHEDIISPELRQSFRDFVKQKGLATPIENGKFRYISVDDVSFFEGNHILTATAYICAYETDKTYYDSAYRRGIIDEKTQSDWLDPLKAGRYDREKVTQLVLNNEYQKCRQVAVAFTTSGGILEDIDSILIDQSDPDSPGWKEYLAKKAYRAVCERSWDPKCFTDAEKQSQELIYTFNANGPSVSISLKDDSEYGSSYMTNVLLSDIPSYINPAILAK